MADNRIVCTRQSDWMAVGHGHIESVGVGDDSGYSEIVAVSNVVAFIKRGWQTYYTYAGGKRAEVSPWNCDRCGRETIRSHADGYWNNNLDALPECR